MKKLIIIILFLLITSVCYGATCFFTGSQTSGFHKICYYNCLGGTVAITVGSLDMCPMSIEE